MVDGIDLRRVVGGVALMVVGLLAVMFGAGALTYSMTDAPQPAAAATTPAVAGGDVTEADLQSARQSLSSVSMVFGFLSAAITGASSSLGGVVDGTEQVFDAVDTAHTGAGQIVDAFQQAPDTTVAAQQASGLIGSISGSLDDAQQLGQAAAQIDGLVAPLVASLESLPAPASEAAGVADTLAQLRGMQDSARSLEAGTGQAAELSNSLGQIDTALQGSSESVDAAIGSALASAITLRDGLGSIAAARGDAVGAAQQLTAGIDQLGGVLEGVNTNLRNATNSLTPGAEPVAADTTAPVAEASTGGNLALSLAIAAAAGILYLLVVWLISLRRTRSTGGGTPLPEQERLPQPVG